MIRFFILLAGFLVVAAAGLAQPPPPAPVAPVAEAATVNNSEVPLPGSRNHDQALRWIRVSSPGDAPVVDPASAGAGGFALRAPEVAPRPASVTRLTLHELILQVAGKNPQIEAQQAHWQGERAAADKERAIFEPRFVTSLELEDSSQRNSAEESASRDFTLTYDERNWNYSAALQGLLPTGGQISLGYDYRRLSNTLIRALDDRDRQYEMFFGLTLTQPLLRDAGVDATCSAIRVADADAEVAFQEYRQEMMRKIAEAAAAYWNLFEAQERLGMRGESLAVAEQILVDARERERLGKMARTEVLEARAGVAARQALQRETRQEHLEAMNRLRTLMSLTAGGEAPLIEAATPAAGHDDRLDHGRLLSRALRLRPEYLAARTRVDRAGLKIAYARNQLWPELDLEASYGLNGLDGSRGGAWEQIEDSEFKDWSIALHLRVPLLGNLQGSSELKRANLEKKRALLALKAVELELANSIDTALHQVASAGELLAHATSVVEIRRELLAAEVARLQAGRSNTRLVLEQEESYRQARDEELVNLVSLQKALLALEVAQGMALVRNGIDPMEVEL